MIPNEKLASDTIRNLTIRSTEKVAEVTVHSSSRARSRRVTRRAPHGDDAATSSSARSRDNAVITLRERAASQAEAERLARELRLRAHRRLRAAGVYG